MLDVRVADVLPAVGRVRLQGDDVEAAHRVDLADAVPAEVEGERAEIDAVWRDRVGDDAEGRFGPADLEAAELDVELADLPHPLAQARDGMLGREVRSVNTLDGAARRRGRPSAARRHGATSDRPGLRDAGRSQARRHGELRSRPRATTSRFGPDRRAEPGVVQGRHARTRGNRACLQTKGPGE